MPTYCFIVKPSVCIGGWKINNTKACDVFRESGKQLASSLAFPFAFLSRSFDLLNSSL